MFYEHNTHYTSFSSMIDGEKDINMSYENNTHYTSFCYMLNREKDLNDKLVF